MRGALSPPLPLVTLYQIHIHFVHRIGALIVLIATWWLAVSVVRRHGNQPALLRPATLLLVLILAQFVLGALTVLMRKPADVATAHVAVGALALVTSFTIFMRACRLYGPRHRGEVLDAPTAPLGGAHPAIN
jgi:cytochrome c oxidase assembly protein subunit 15